jgi:chaperonin GroEL (HSP60 family)
LTLHGLRVTLGSEVVKMKKNRDLKIPKPMDIAADIVSGLAKSTDMYEETGDGKSSAILFAGSAVGAYLNKFVEMNTQSDYDDIDKDNE